MQIITFPLRLSVNQKGIMVEQLIDRRKVRAPAPHEICYFIWYLCYIIWICFLLSTFPFEFIQCFLQIMEWYQWLCFILCTGSSYIDGEKFEVTWLCSNSGVSNMNLFIIIGVDSCSSTKNSVFELIFDIPRWQGSAKHVLVWEHRVHCLPKIPHLVCKNREELHYMSDENISSFIVSICITTFSCNQKKILVESSAGTKLHYTSDQE